MAWHTIAAAIIFLLVGAYLGTKVPQLNLIGRVVG